MSRLRKFTMLGVATAMLGACNNVDEVITTPDIPTAGVRFIHAVPDTGSLDMRFVDIPENSSHYAIPFRNNIVTSSNIPASTMVQYKNTRAGTNRKVKVFLNSIDQAVAQTTLVDTEVNLVAGTNYTFILWGYANPAGPNRPAGAPAMRFDVVEETVADASPNVSLRVINTTTSALDVRAYKYTAAVPATATFANVAAMTFSPYVAVAPDTFRFNVRTAGAATNLIATNFIALRGEPAVTVAPGPFDAIPGTAVAGSAVSAIVFPRSVTGTAAPQTTAFQSPMISFVWDRRPPRPAGT